MADGCAEMIAISARTGIVRATPLGRNGEDGSRPQAGRPPATMRQAGDACALGRRHRSAVECTCPAAGESDSERLGLGGVAPLTALLSALCGPSARCGQDARAPRNIAPRATPWERGRPARKRAEGPPHEQAGDACALGRRHRSHDHALGGGVGGSGVSLLSALCGPSARCGQDARAPRNIAPGAVPRAGELVARGCRSSRRFAGLRPVAGKMPALPGTSLPGPPPWAGE